MQKRTSRQIIKELKIFSVKAKFQNEIYIYIFLYKNNKNFICYELK